MAKCTACGHDNPPGVSWCVSCSKWLDDVSSSPTLDTTVPLVSTHLPETTAPSAASAPNAPSLAADAKPLMERAAALVQSGQKIMAVKLVREERGLGLAEAKEIVDRLETALQPASAAVPVECSVREAPNAVEPPADLHRQVAAVLKSQGKIQAIKVYRELTGLGLKESKDAVEALEREVGGAEDIPVAELAPSPRVDRTELETKVVRLMRDNRKIDAIKVFREATGASLYDAKQAVEGLAARHGVATKGGCTAVVLLAVLVFIGALSALVLFT